MKTIKMFFVFLSVLMNSSLLHAQEKGITWITTAFWTAPQVREFSPVLKVLKEENLIKSCREYRIRIDALSFPQEADLVERFRTHDSISSDGSFVARFNISQMEESYQNYQRFDGDVSVDKLPFYTQSEAVTSANLDENTFYQIHTSEGSFTEFSRSLKLKDSEYSIVYERGQAILQIFGKDLACDLMAGNISFELTTSSFVRINNDNYDKMLQFYLNQIQPDLTAITSVNSKDNQVLKAAKLGYRFGNHLKALSGHNSKFVDVQIENLMNTLFIPGTLRNSAEVLDSVDGKKKEIQVSSLSVGKSVKVFLKYQK